MPLFKTVIKNKSGNEKHLISVNKITKSEITAAIKYALNHTEYRNKKNNSKKFNKSMNKAIFFLIFI